MSTEKQVKEATPEEVEAIYGKLEKPIGTIKTVTFPEDITLY